MLLITEKQLQLLNISQRDEFILRLDKFLKDDVRLGFLVDPDDPYEYVDRIILYAERLGIYSEIGTAYYAILVSHFGFLLQGIADRPWFSVLHRDANEKADPDWIERVYHTVIECLRADF